MASTVSGAEASSDMAGATAPSRGGLPLFFQKPAALEKQRHAKSGIVAANDYLFAKSANSVALAALEFIEASKFYPIVFSVSEAPVPLAILGLEQDNYFVDAQGKWRNDDYIPAYIRQYPFVFFESDKEEKFYLCVDEKSLRFRADGGEDAQPLFNADGAPSPLTNQALEFCNSYHQHHLVTRNFVADLKKHDLLQPYQSSFMLKNGKKVSLTGFTMIDETIFNALPEAVFHEFREKGWLAFIYLAMASASNWRRLSAHADAQLTAH